MHAWYVTLHPNGNMGVFRFQCVWTCLLALVLLRVPAWLLPCAFHWTSYLCSPSGLCATLAAMANARERERERDRDVISIYLHSAVSRRRRRRTATGDRWARAKHRSRTGMVGGRGRNQARAAPPPLPPPHPAPTRHPPRLLPPAAGRTRERAGAGARAPGSRGPVAGPGHGWRAGPRS